MSADAKVWKENGSWKAIHDGECSSVYKSSWLTYGTHDVSSYDLTLLLQEIEKCMNKGRGMRWELRSYPNDEMGLSGYIT